MSFSLDFRAHSEVGLVRKNNQDSGYASPNLIVVADGMGGAAAGDLASTVAIAEIEAADERYEGDEMLTAFAGAVSKANDKIADLIAADHSLDGMGTTVCGAMFSGTQLGIVHIGDSRGYLMRDGKLIRLTHDHSWVQSLIDEGKIDEEEAAVHPHRSLVLKVLNGHPTHQPDTDIVDVKLGDRVLFCSDGLSGFTTDGHIAELIQLDDLDEAVEKLTLAAHAGGGADNITLVLAEVQEQSEALDTVPPQVLGAALTVEIPHVEPAAKIDLGDDATDEADEKRVPRAPAPAVVNTEAETLRYAPTLAKRRRWVAPLVVGLVTLLALAGLGFGGYKWSRTQYYVGEATGNVAVYNGLPGGIFSLRFANVIERTEVLVEDLPQYYRTAVADTIKVADKNAATTTVDQLRQLAAACKAERTKQPTPPPSETPSPSASSSASPSATPSGSASTTPSATPSGTPSTTLSSSPTATSQTPSATPSSTSSPNPGGGC